MQSSSSRFVSNIVPLQNVQTNVSGQGQIQVVQANILALQTSIQTIQATLSAQATFNSQVQIEALQATVTSLQTTIADLQARVALLESKV